MSNEPDHSEVLGTWSLVSRINNKEEFLGDVSIEKLRWDLGGRVYRAVIESEEGLKNLYEILKKQFGDETRSRDERVREYWKLPESERATYGVVKDYRGDILALEPNAVVGMVESDRRPCIYTPETLRGMGFYDLAEIVAGPNTPLRQAVAHQFMQYDMTPAKVNAEIHTPAALLRDSEEPNIEADEEPRGCVEE